MSRSAVNITLNSHLLVIILYRASILGRGTNEEIEELLYRAIREEEEDEGTFDSLAHLDDVYGEIHNHWEGQTTRHNLELQLPF